MNRPLRIAPSNTRIEDFEDNSPDARRFFSELASALEAAEAVIVDVSGQCRTLEEFKTICTALSSSLGQLMVQNEAGDTVVEVYDRKVGRIEEGARYHQTRQGGDIHTDSVNRPEPMRYLALGCAAPAAIGGESILIRGQDVLSVLKGHPEVIDCLSGEFIFEGRGMNADNALFRVPVLQVENGKARFRYLRSYIASAHARAGQPLTPAQVNAFDVLDCILEMSRYQSRFTLQPGEVLFANDTTTFHGRTSFIDGPVPGAFADRRYMLRYWID